MCSRRIMGLAVVVATTCLWPSVAGADLVGYFTFDGNLNDASALANNGSFSGGTVSYVADRNGTPGAALLFDGLNDKVTIGTSGRGTDSFTYGGWMKTAQVHEIDPEASSGAQGVSGQRYAFGAYNMSTNGGSGLSVGINGLSVYEHGNSYMPALAVFDPGDSTTVGSGWNHVMVAYDGKQPTIYLNGQPVRTGFTSPKTTVYAPIEIGGGSYGYFDGPMDDVTLWNHQLSREQIQALAGGASPTNIGVTLINPSFEEDSFTVYPGYVSGNGPITGWTSNNTSSGVNPIVGGSSPFADNGAIPDGQQVAFLQRGTGLTGLSQTAIGFEPGETYLVTYRENSRAQGAAAGSFMIDAQTLVPQHSVAYVGGSNPYYHVAAKLFAATSSAHTLTFTNHQTAHDNSLLLDDVQIHQMYLKFADNYNTIADTLDINPAAGNDEPGRQGGHFAPLTYTESDASKSQIAGDQLLIAGPGINRVSPNHNFNLNSLADAHFVLEFEVDPGVSSGDDWAAVVFGSSSQSASVNSSDGIGMLFRHEGGYQIFDGTVANHSIQGGTLPGAGGVYDVQIHYFVPGFDDTTPGMVDIWVNEALIRSFTTDSGFANNYMNFVGYSTVAMDTPHVFDNLRIYSSFVPEPGSLSLLVLGVVLLLGRVRRRRD